MKEEKIQEKSEQNKGEIVLIGKKQSVSIKNVKILADSKNIELWSENITMTVSYSDIMSIGKCSDKLLIMIREQEQDFSQYFPEEQDLEEANELLAEIEINLKKKEKASIILSGHITLELYLQQSYQQLYKYIEEQISKHEKTIQQQEPVIKINMEMDMMDGGQNEDAEMQYEME